MDTAVYLERMLEPLSRCFTPESAKRLIDLRVDPELQKRIDALAGKCTEGELTEEEHREYDAYVRTGSLISMLQLKARQTLAAQGQR